MRLPVVAIVGRPNVGKSTLFNRLARRRISIVEDLPGVTRDRLYAQANWEDYRFTLIDTGGFEPEPEDRIFQAVREQTRLAIDEADVIILVVDARAGTTPADRDVASELRRSGRPVFIAANKADSPKQADFAAEFYELGIADVLPISAAHGMGVSDLMEAVFERLPGELVAASEEALLEWERERAEQESDDALDRALQEAREDLEGDDDERIEDFDDAEMDEDGEFIEAQAESAPAEPTSQMPEVLRISVIGRPNAGKSSLVNKLLGEERHLVSDIPGTTVDAVDSFLEFGGTRFRLIDTAGIRRKRSISLQMEKYAVVSALKGLDRCDVAFFLIDPLEGLTEQDLKVAAFAHDKGKGVVIVVNKWDLARAQGLNAQEVAERIRERTPFLAYAPIRFVSAKTGRKVFDLLDSATEVAQEYFTRIPTGALNRVLRAAVDAHPPPVHKGKRVKLYYAAQVRVGPPTFVIATNQPQGVHFSYRRFVQNRVREAFGFKGTPLRIFYRQRGDEAGRQKNLEARARTAGKKSPRRHQRRKK